MENNLELKKKVISVINSDISPIIKSHGGKINIKSINNGVVTITLGGNCNNCISAQVTTQEIVKEKLIEKLGGEVKDVKLYSDIDDDIWDFAKKILRGENRELERKL